MSPADKHDDAPSAVAAEIRRTVDDLRLLIAAKTTSSVVGQCLAFNLRRANDDNYDGDLRFPHRQLVFLLSLLAETEEPTQGTEVDAKDWDNICRLLSQAFESYVALFLPEEGQEITDEWSRVRALSMQAFLHYFHSGLLASYDQVAKRIERYLTPFDASLERLIGISGTDALLISRWLTDRAQAEVDRLGEYGHRLRQIMDESFQGARSPEEVKAKARTPENRQFIDEYLAAMSAFGTVRRDDIVTEFPTHGPAFWFRFSIARGEGPSLTFPTERCIAETRPLFRTSDDAAICPGANQYLIAILAAGEEALQSDPETRANFLRHRDKSLEDETRAAFKDLLGQGAQLYTTVFESADATHEHDLVAIRDDTVFFVESKAAPPTEPFRDPERAHTRIARSFTKGIQAGYEQAAALRRRLDNREQVPLYDDRGRELVVLDPNRLRKRFCVVVTRDNFGVIATDLALLLEKPNDEPYPWVVNTLDLEAIAAVWNHYGWPLSKLTHFLDDRVRLHGRIISSDELEYVGFFMTHGSLKWLLPKSGDNSLCQLEPHYSDVFDKLYRHWRYGLPAPKLNIGPPVSMDLRASLIKGKPVMSKPFYDPGKRVGRNDPCPCGSGVKFKKCHGK